MYVLEKEGPGKEAESSTKKRKQLEGDQREARGHRSRKAEPRSLLGRVGSPGSLLRKACSCGDGGQTGL